MTTTAQTVARPQSVRGPKPTVGGIASRYGLLVVWAIEIVMFSVLLPETFPTLSSFQQLASSQASLVVLALSVVPTMAAGEVDLSIAAVMGMSATIFGQLNGQDGWNPVLAAVVALLASTAVGAVSGIVTVYLRVRGLIVTLGMGTLVLGVTLFVSNSLTVGGISPEFGAIFNTRVAGVNLAFFYAIVIALVLWYLLRHTPWGRSMLFVGFNPDVAHLSGINGKSLRLQSFMIGSFVAGLAGLASIGIAGGADPTAFQPLLLAALAATFLGTLVFTPGQTNPLGTVVALYFLATGIYGIQLLGVGTWVSNVFYGGALVIIVAISGAAGGMRRNAKKGKKA